MSAQKAKLTAAMVSVLLATASGVAAAADTGLTPGGSRFHQQGGAGKPDGKCRQASLLHSARWIQPF